jgi:hypothetical protein
MGSRQVPSSLAAAPVSTNQSAAQPPPHTAPLAAAAGTSKEWLNAETPVYLTTGNRKLYPPNQYFHNSGDTDNNATLSNTTLSNTDSDQPWLGRVKIELILKFYPMKYIF